MTILDRLAAYDPPTDFQPIQVEYSLATPLMMAFPWIFGDALVARMLMEDLLGDAFYNLPAKEPLPVSKFLRLPLQKTDMIYHASASILDTDEMHTTILYKRFHEAEDLKTKTRIRRNSGMMRDYMMKFPYSASKTVKFYTNGDLKELKRLLSPIKHLGKKRAVGGGQVCDFKIEPIAEDWSIIKDDIAMRSIPCNMLKSFSDIRAMRLAYTFPGWDQANVTMCVAPGGRCEI